MVTTNLNFSTEEQVVWSKLANLNWWKWVLITFLYHCCGPGSLTSDSLLCIFLVLDFLLVQSVLVSSQSPLSRPCVCLISLCSVLVAWWLFFPVLSNTFGVPMFSPFLFPCSSVSSLCLSRLSCLHVCLAPVPLSSPCVLVLVCFFLFYFDGPLSCVRDVEFCFLFLVSYDSVQLCSHVSPIPLITLLYIYILCISRLSYCVCGLCHSAL